MITASTTPVPLLLRCTDRQLGRIRGAIARVQSCLKALLGRVRVCVCVGLYVFLCVVVHLRAAVRRPLHGSMHNCPRLVHTNLVTLIA